MKKLILALVFALCFVTCAFAVQTSTINPLLPLQSAPLTSGPIRSNFQSAYNDINNIYSLLGSGGGSISYPSAGVANSTGSAWGASFSTTGSGNVVLSTSPTLVTPVLGTPTSGTLTNAVGLPISTGLTGTGTGVLTALGNAANGSGGFVTSTGSAANVTGVVAAANGGTGSASIPSSGNILVGNTGGTAYAPVVLSSDCTLTYTGAITCLSTNGTSFGTLATLNAAPAGTLTGATLAAGVTASSLTSVGTIATGVWNGTVVTGQYGGTGVANTGHTITIGSNVTMSGAYSFTGTLTGATSVTFPTSGTLSTTTGTVTAVSVATANGFGGSSSGGATPALTITCSTCIQSASTWAQGDILYYNGSNWVDLPVGTSGYFLTTHGASANPTWTAGSGGSGTVTSVTFTGDGTVESSTPSSAVTTSGTVTATLANAGAGTVLGNATSSSAAPTYTTTPQLGKSGTLGSVTMGNATSGLLTLEPVTGALGTVTVSIPAATDTLVNLAGTQTLTNKTLTSPTLTTPALGTPASGVMTSVTGLPLTSGVTGVLPVANGGTNASSASITAFNNVTGYSASGATGTTSTNLVFSTSPSVTTPTFVTNATVPLLSEALAQQAH